MRVYLPHVPAPAAAPTAPVPAVAAPGGPVGVSDRRPRLAAGLAVWGVSAAARADRPGEDAEDLEYEALQDAVHVALSAADPARRALVTALDVPDGSLADASTDGGAFGLTLREDTTGRVAAFHVTEADARAAAADDTDPALLWFDVAEGADALAYLAGPETAPPPLSSR